jgi:YVTN family beta-propeller protein
MRLVSVALAAFAVLAAAPAALGAARQTFCVVSNSASNTVSVVDATQPPTVTATVPVGTSPQGIALTPDGKTALVADAGDGTVLFIDTATNAIEGGVGVGGSPRVVALSPDGALAYVLSNTLTVIDVAARAVTATIAVGPAPTALAVSPDGRFVYVGDFSDFVASVSKIDVAKLATPSAALVETISGLVAGFGATGLAVSADGTTLYVADLQFHPVQNRSVAILDVGVSPATLKGFFGPFTDFPGGALLAPDGANLLVSEGGRIDIVSTATGTIGATLLTATDVGGLGAAALSADGTRAYVIDGFGAMSVFAIPAGGTALNTVTVGSSPSGIACGLRPEVLAMTRFSPAVAIDLSARPGQDRLAFAADLTLGAGNNDIDPTREGATLELDSFTLAVPPARFVRTASGFAFTGTVNGVKVALALQRVTLSSYRLALAATAADLRAVTNPTTVRLTLGDDQGTASVTAKIRR